MRRTVKNKTGIRWNVFEQLENLEFADGICLLLEKRRQMLKYTKEINTEVKKIGINLNVSKTKVMKVNTPREMGIVIDGQEMLINCAT